MPVDTLPNPATEHTNRVYALKNRLQNSTLPPSELLSDVSRANPFKQLALSMPVNKSAHGKIISVHESLLLMPNNKNGVEFAWCYRVRAHFIKKATTGNRVGSSSGIKYLFAPLGTYKLDDVENLICFLLDMHFHRTYQYARTSKEQQAFTQVSTFCQSTAIAAPPAFTALSGGL